MAQNLTRMLLHGCPPHTNVCTMYSDNKETASLGGYGADLLKTTPDEDSVDSLDDGTAVDVCIMDILPGVRYQLVSEGTIWLPDLKVTPLT